MSYTILLSIDGMTCQSCVSTIEGLVNQIDDVEKIKVSFYGYNDEEIFRVNVLFIIQVH